MAAIRTMARAMPGKWFNIVSYEVEEDTHLIDMAKVREKPLAERPKLIGAGASAYPRQIDFAAFGALRMRWRLPDGEHGALCRPDRSGRIRNPAPHGCHHLDHAQDAALRRDPDQ